MNIQMADIAPTMHDRQKSRTLSSTSCKQQANFTTALQSSEPSNPMNHTPPLPLTIVRPGGRTMVCGPRLLAARSGQGLHAQIVPQGLICKIER